MSKTEARDLGLHLMSMLSRSMDDAPGVLAVESLHDGFRTRGRFVHKLQAVAVDEAVFADLACELAQRTRRSKAHDEAQLLKDAGSVGRAATAAAAPLGQGDGGTAATRAAFGHLFRAVDHACRGAITWEQLTGSLLSCGAQGWLGEVRAAYLPYRLERAHAAPHLSNLLLLQNVSVIAAESQRVAGTPPQPQGIVDGGDDETPGVDPGLLVAISRGSACLLSLRDRFQPSVRFQTPPQETCGGVTCVAFVGRHKAVAIGSADCQVRLYEAATGREVLAGADGGEGSSLRLACPPTCLAFDSTLELLYVGCRDGTVTSAAAEVRMGCLGGALVRKRAVRHQKGQISQLICALDLGLFTAAYCGLVLMLDARTLAVLKRFSQHTQGVTSLAYSRPYNVLVSAGFGWEVLLWMVTWTNGEPFALKDPSAPHAATVVGVAMVPGTAWVVSADAKGLVKVWDVRTLRCTQTLDVVREEAARRSGPPRRVRLRSLAVARSARDGCWRVVAGADRALWAFTHAQPAFRSAADAAPVLRVQCSTFSRFLFTASLDAVKTWDSCTHGLLTSQKAPEGDTISAFSIDHRCRRFIVGHISGRVNVYNASSGEVVASHAAGHEVIGIVCTEAHIVVASLTQICLLVERETASSGNLSGTADRATTAGATWDVVQCFRSRDVPCRDGKEEGKPPQPQKQKQPRGRRRNQQRGGKKKRAGGGGGSSGGGGDASEVGAVHPLLWKLLQEGSTEAEGGNEEQREDEGETNASGGAMKRGANHFVCVEALRCHNTELLAIASARGPISVVHFPPPHCPTLWRPYQSIPESPQLGEPTCVVLCGFAQVFHQQEVVAGMVQTTPSRALVAAVGYSEGTVVVWLVSTLPGVTCALSRTRTVEVPRCLAYEPDCFLLVVGYDRGEVAAFCVRAPALPTVEWRRTAAHAEGTAVLSVLLTSGTAEGEEVTIVTSGEDRCVFLWKLSTGRTLGALEQGVGGRAKEANTEEDRVSRGVEEAPAAAEAPAVPAAGVSRGSALSLSSGAAAGRCGSEKRVPGFASDVFSASEGSAGVGQSKAVRRQRSVNFGAVAADGGGGGGGTGGRRQRSLRSSSKSPSRRGSFYAKLQYAETQSNRIVGVQDFSMPVELTAFDVVRFLLLLQGREREEVARVRRASGRTARRRWLGDDEEEDEEEYETEDDEEDSDLCGSRPLLLRLSLEVVADIAKFVKPHFVHVAPRAGKVSDRGGSLDEGVGGAQRRARCRPAAQHAADAAAPASLQRGSTVSATAGGGLLGGGGGGGGDGAPAARRPKRAQLGGCRAAAATPEERAANAEFAFLRSQWSFKDASPRGCCGGDDEALSLLLSQPSAGPAALPASSAAAVLSCLASALASVVLMQGFLGPAWGGGGDGESSVVVAAPCRAYGAGSVVIGRRRRGYVEAPPPATAAEEAAEMRRAAASAGPGTKQRRKTAQMAGELLRAVALARNDGVASEEDEDVRCVQALRRTVPHPLFATRSDLLEPRQLRAGQVREGLGSAGAVEQAPLKAAPQHLFPRSFHGATVPRHCRRAMRSEQGGVKQGVRPLPGLHSAGSGDPLFNRAVAASVAAGAQLPF